jgi:cytochrome c-type biogenesis protein CcmH
LRLAVFWIFVVLLIGASLAFILPPLLRKQQSSGVGYRESNITVQRNRREELERMLLDGDLDQDAYDEARRELELELHDELASDGPPRENSSETRPVAAIMVAVLLPVAALVLYFLLGSPEALMNGARSGDGGQGPGGVAGTAPGQIPHSVEEMVERLAQRLEQSPEDPEGWLMLGRSYAAMSRFPEARAALLEANQRQPGEPATLVTLAEVEAALNGNDLAGKPTELLQRALEIDPDLVRALWLAGIAAFDQGDTDAATAYWQRILENPTISDANASQVRQAIAQVRQSASSGMAQDAPRAVEKATPSGAKGLTVGISLAPELADKVSSADTLYVFARAAEGPRMPLAIVRKTAGELPMTLQLDDSMAMTPQLRLSAYPSVVVGARISKSGSATPQPGDLSGASPEVSPSRAEVVGVVINKIEK